MADSTLREKTNGRERAISRKEIVALRRAKELALEVGADADSVGWPCLWLPGHVLVYGPRPDGKCQIDDLTDADEVYYVTQVARTLADGFVAESALRLFHVNRPARRSGDA